MKGLISSQYFSYSSFSVLHMPDSLSATFLVIYSLIFFTKPSFCSALLDTLSGRSGQSPSGGEITVKGYGERGDQSYISAIDEIAPNKHYYRVDWDGKPPYFGSDSWLAGEWWSIKYTKETAPYEMVIIIQPNPSDQERIIKLEYGCCYMVSHVTLTQKGK